MIKHVLIHSLNIGIKKNVNDAVCFKLPKSSTVSIVATKNKFAAAPIKINQININNNPKCLFINSGNANAGTGSEGMKNAINLTKLLSKKLNCRQSEILLFSTGIIGQQLPMKSIKKKIITSDFRFKSTWISASKAIMTTDKFNKIISKNITINGRKISVNGICKGAGMIEPNMATMLSFISVDLHINKRALNKLLKTMVDKSFNKISVDGDRSTNDSVALIATGNNSEISTNNPKVMSQIETQLSPIFTKLSEMIINDGEGSTKQITINISKVNSKSIARNIAYSIANSNLFKTAMYGSDPNWGRIIARLGSMDAVKFTPSKVTLLINNILVFKNETNTKQSNSIKLKKSMKRKKIIINLIINSGNSSFTLTTSDLSKKYVHLNSAYPS